MPKKSFVHLREHAFDSGMYNLLLDLKQNPNFSQNLPEWQSIVSHFQLNLGASKTELSNREAFFIEFGQQPTNLLTPDLHVEQHLSFDRKYLDGFSGDSRKLHYCHLTQEYRDANNTLQYVLHVNFNNIGEVVATYFKNFITGERIIDIDQNKLTVIITEASTVLSALLALKEQQQKQNELHVSGLLLEISKCNQPAKLQHKYQAAVERAQRYADVYLDYSDELANEFSALNVKATASEASAEPVKLTTQVNVPAKQTETRLQTRWKELKAECQQIKANPFPNYLEFMGLKFALGDLYITAKLQKSDLAVSIKKLLENFEYPQTALNNALATKNITLQFLEANYRNIAADIPNEFYTRMIEACIQATDAQMYEKYAQICQFLFIRSFAYREVISTLCNVSEQSINQDGDYTAPAATLLLQCYYRNNPRAFELLLSHGIRLGNAGIYLKKDGSGYTISKYIIELMIFDYLSNESAAHKQKLKAFITVMHKPEFRSGFGVENLRSKISLEQLRKRIAKGRVVSRAAASQSNDGQDESTYFYMSAFQYAMRRNLEPDILRIFAIHANFREEHFDRLCAAVVCLIRQNDFDLVINDPIFAVNPNAPRLASADRPDIDQVFENIDNTPQNAALNLRIYVRFYGQSDHAILEIIDQLIKQALQHASQDDINQFFSRYNTLMSVPEQRVIRYYESVRSCCLTAILVLINMPEARRTSQYYLLLLQFIAKHTSMMVMECDDDIDSEDGEIESFLAEELEDRYQEVKDVYEAMVNNGLIMPALALEVLKRNKLDIKRFHPEVNTPQSSPKPKLS